MRLTVNGELVRRSTGTENKRLAEELYGKLRKEVREGRYCDQGNKKTFKDMADRYMAEYAIKKALKTMQRDKVSLTHLLPIFGGKLLSQITPAQITSYKNQRRNEGASPKSINHELGFCKCAFNVAGREWQWIKTNPFTSVSMERLPQPRVRYLTADEFERLYQECNDRLKPIVRIAVNTGMRQGNILSLTWQQVDLSRGEINLEHTKNGERLTLPMNGTVKTLLSELKKASVRNINHEHDHVFHTSTGGKIDPSELNKWFRKTCRMADIGNFRFHDLRHTFASWLIQKGVSLYEVQRLLGHKTGEMTRRYAHLAPDNLRTAVNSLSDIVSNIKTDIGSVERNNNGV